MSHSLSKRDAKLVSSGASKTAARWRDRSRSQRMTGVVSGLSVAFLDAKFGAMLPSVNVPGLGPTSVGALVGGLLALRYASQAAPSTLDTAVGFGGLMLAGRSFK